MGAEVLLSVPPSSVLCTLSQKRTEGWSTQDKFLLESLSQPAVLCAAFRQCRKLHPVKDNLKNAAVGKKPLVSLPLSVLSLSLFFRNGGFQTCQQLSGKREEEKKCKQRNYGRAIAAQRQRNQPFQGWQQQHWEAQTVMRKRQHMRGRGGLQSRASKYSRKAWVCLSVQPASGWLCNRGTAEIEVREGEMGERKGEGEGSGRW